MQHPRITAELVERLVAEQFPEWSHLPVAAVKVNGWDNTTFRLGDELSVRLPNGDAYASQVDKEQRWLPVLAPQVPLQIPEPVGHGRPSAVFPSPWSVYRWIEGETATSETVADAGGLAIDLAEFLNALYCVDPDGGPRPDKFNRRGGPLRWLDEWTRSALTDCSSEVDAAALVRIWEASLTAEMTGRPAWVHGDVAATNLLVRGGRLAAVIDFGCLAVGDPACDLMIAWTYFDSDDRALFRESLRLDDRTRERGRGWALWKAALVLQDDLIGSGTQPHWTQMGWTGDPKSVIERLMTDWPPAT